MRSRSVVTPPFGCREPLARRPTRRDEMTGRRQDWCDNEILLAAARRHEGRALKHPKDVPTAHGIRIIVNQASIVLFSSVFVQAVTFGVQSLSAALLPVPAFAELSLIVAAAMVSVAFFDLGLGLSVTKKYCESLDEGYLRMSFFVWSLLIPVGAAIGVLVAEVIGDRNIGIGIAIGAVLNLWNGVRSVDQARQDYRSFLHSNLAFGTVRLIAGLTALYLSQSPAVVSLCIYAAPLVVLPLTASSFRFALEAFRKPRHSLADIAGYSLPVYLNAICFVALPFLPQFFVSARLGPIEAGTYGVILTFTAPTTLVINTIYNVLLPKFLDGRSRLEQRLWGTEGAILMIAATACIFLVGAIGGYFLSHLYGHRFPEIGPLFALYFVGYSISAILGIYTLSVHTLGVPTLAMVVHSVKLLATLSMLFAFGSNLRTIIALTVTMMIAGQCVVILFLRLARTRRANADSA